MDAEILKKILESNNPEVEGPNIEKIVGTVNEIAEALNIDIEERNVFLSEVGGEEKICIFLKSHIFITAPIDVQREKLQYQIYPFKCKSIDVKQGGRSDYSVEVQVEGESIFIHANNKDCADGINGIIKKWVYGNEQ